MGNERSAAVIGAAGRRIANAPLASRAKSVAVRRVSILAVAFVSLLVAGAASAQPTVTISPPVTRGQQGSGAVPSVVTDQSTAKRIEEDRAFRMNRIIIEGFRDPDDRTPRPELLEQRFTTSLNRGSPEFIAGRVYDGCHYDGSYFSCADPLSSAIRNLRHALR
jgi:hypothetical protein